MVRESSFLFSTGTVKRFDERMFCSARNWVTRFSVIISLILSVIQLKRGEENDRQVLNKPKPFSKYKFELWFGAIALLVVLLDQLTKFLVMNYKPNLNLVIITIHLIQNTGAGFGILKNQAFFLGIISLCAALLVLFYYRKIEKKYFPQILFGMFLGGVLGNLIDRWFRGAVVDFLDLPFWPAFNVADACITVSVIGLVIWYWKKE